MVVETDAGVVLLEAPSADALVFTAASAPAGRIESLLPPLPPGVPVSEEESKPDGGMPALPNLDNSSSVSP